ncbi:MAG: hypothetical protein KAH20_03160 [Methylococcales bacterium]|nr:hypothetical protein [Methylococcales bacterium]
MQQVANPTSTIVREGGGANFFVTWSPIIYHETCEGALNDVKNEVRVLLMFSLWLE